MKKCFFLAFSVFLSVLLVSQAGAFDGSGPTLVRVSQESSPDEGDFDDNVLGFIEAFDGTGKTTAEYYQYNVPNGASFNGPLPILTSNRSHLFLVKTDDGLSLFLVHDKPDDGTGGSAQNEILLVGDPDGAAFLAEDDPGEGFSGGPESFHSTKNWAPCCTDGMAIGSLDGPWTAFVNFYSFGGLSEWFAESADDNDIQLVFQPERRVRLDVLSNHYLGYTVRRIEGDGEEVPVVRLTDQFNEEGAVFKVIKKSAVHYNPVNKNGEGIPHYEVHQVGYAVMRTEGTDPPRTVDVTNQFGTITVTTGAANRLLVPSVKKLGDDNGLAPTLLNGHLPEEVENHFLCYGLESYGEFEPREVTVADQFKGTRPFSVLRPIALCNPVTKEHQYPDGDFGRPEPPVKPENHLLCYGGGVKTRERFETIRFETRNQFGFDIWEARRDGGVLCVPSEKEEKEETGACCFLKDKNSTFGFESCEGLTPEECTGQGGIVQPADSCEELGGVDGCQLIIREVPDDK